jgi:5-methylcytosine-specific restriction endonuclease McrA
MSLLDNLKPKQKYLVMNLLGNADIDVSAWKKYKGPPAANPKYCYNWSFEQPDELVAVCLWHKSLKLRGSTVVHTSKRINYTAALTSRSEAIWNRRAQAFDESLELAYRQQLPIRVIVVDGVQRDRKAKEPTASVVHARLLDRVPWAITEYDYSTGERLLVRGAKPVNPAVASADWELSWFEGLRKRKFVFHRQREGRARRAKIKDVLTKNGGRLVCEVENCGFDFKQRYGALGEGYAQVHHLAPLSGSPVGGREIKLKDLVVVCANCHVMIHIGGVCRSLEGLIP